MLVVRHLWPISAQSLPAVTDIIENYKVFYGVCNSLNKRQTHTKSYMAFSFSVPNWINVVTITFDPATSSYQYIVVSNTLLHPVSTLAPSFHTDSSNGTTSVSLHNGEQLELALSSNYPCP